MAERLDLLIAPDYCQYADGACDQTMPMPTPGRVLFLFPAEPDTVASTVEAAVARLQADVPSRNWLTWRDLPIAGQVIFCEVCRGMRSADVIVADVTTLNMNVMFEIGYAIGLGLPVLPIRDTSIETDKRDFEALGLLDNLGYLDFTNSTHLEEGLRDRVEQARPLTPPRPGTHRDSPLYVVKSELETEGALQLLATIKKSALKFRAFDPIETPRLPMLEAMRQVASSVGVIGHLLSSARRGSRVHNARSAFVAGLALSQQKVVLLLQEGSEPQPIDYRDVVRSFSNITQIPRLLESTFQSVVVALQVGSTQRSLGTRPVLQQLDLGDVAAENEINGLRHYFVATGPATQARQGHARLVVGRKGSGKTAIFYDVRNSRPGGHDSLVIDLKPEGHQFSRLRDFAEAQMTAGLREHTMVAFWNYILLSEVARVALDQDRIAAGRDPVRRGRWERLDSIYQKHDPGWDADFSQRLLAQIDRVTARLAGTSPEEYGAKLTALIYEGDVRELTSAVADYLKGKDSVWLLVDNIDKGWPVRGATSADMLVVRGLLEATRKLQHQLESDDVDFECLVFLRSDIYEHLRRDTPDKGKDTAISLDWEDVTVFEEIVRLRIEASTQLRGTFRELWPAICDPLVGSVDSFAYVVERTLMRPRDLLQFLHRCVDVAINRGHDRIHQEDLLTAEKGYSEDILLATDFEISDTRPELRDVLYSFQGAPTTLSRDDVSDRLTYAGIAYDDVENVMELLMWFSFFGVSAPHFQEPKYAYSVQFNLRRLMYPLTQGDGSVVIHPAFRAALDNY